MSSPKSPSDPARLGFRSASARIRDYAFVYSVLEIDAARPLVTVFPRSGYLILSLITGSGFKSRFLNYDRSVARANRMYISGLLTGSSLLVRQTGRGGGCAMKIHPVIGYHLFRVPLHQLTDRQFRCCRVLGGKWGRWLKALEANCRIASFDDPEVRKLFLEALPPKSVYEGDVIYHAVNEIIADQGIIRVGALARKYFMSERTLHRQFLRKVGVAPQVYAKIWQVHYAMQLLRRWPTASLPRVAAEAGYYDVAHLARDFRNKVALPPATISEHLNPLARQYLGAAAALL